MILVDRQSYRFRAVWIVEDSHEDFEVLMASFQSAGINQPIVRFESGDQILAELRKPLTLDRQPMVILLDLNLPGTDGRTVAQKFKEHSEYRAIPIIVLSTSANPKDLELCYRAGVNAYLVKPMDHDRMDSMIRSIKDFWLEQVFYSMTPATSD